MRNDITLRIVRTQTNHVTLNVRFFQYILLVWMLAGVGEKVTKYFISILNWNRNFNLWNNISPTFLKIIWKIIKYFKTVLQIIQPLWHTLHRKSDRIVGGKLNEFCKDLVSLLRLTENRRTYSENSYWNV